MKTTCIKTPLGIAKIMGDSIGIFSLNIENEAVEITPEIPFELQEAITQIEEYFQGTRKQFTFKINPKGTDFQQKIWRELLQIPFGKTVSYMDVTKKLGDVKAIRAVASANAKNPLWIVIPCHRVIGSDGTLTGYAGGLWRKKWLLNHENPSEQQSLF